MKQQIGIPQQVPWLRGSGVWIGCSTAGQEPGRITSRPDPDGDVLPDGGEAYGARPTGAGIPVRVTRYLGMSHGFLQLAPGNPEERRAIQEVVDELQGILSF